MDRKRFDTMVRDTQEPLRRFLCALCCGDSALADDIAQESYIKAYLSIDGLRDRAAFAPWLYRIAYNMFLSRRRTVRDTVPVDEARAVVADDSADTAFRYQGLHAALAALGDAERTAILLFYMEDRPVKEIAAITGDSEGTIRQRLSRGRVRLHDLLQKQK